MHLPSQALKSLPTIVVELSRSFPIWENDCHRQFLSACPPNNKHNHHSHEKELPQLPQLSRLSQLSQLSQLSYGTFFFVWALGSHFAGTIVGWGCAGQSEALNFSRTLFTPPPETQSFLFPFHLILHDVPRWREKGASGQLPFFCGRV